jgi:Ca2+-binding EF-hand superfamily protein
MMMKVSQTAVRALAIAGALVVAAGSARADEKADKRDKEIEERFKAADKDQDGKLTLAEAKAGMPRIAKAFDKIDKDKKGYLTVDQIKAFAAAQ